MKCLNCGCESSHYLCETCKNSEVLDKIFHEICSYRSETCENLYLKEYASELSERFAERNIIPDILEQFDYEMTQYYYCKYYRLIKDACFEEIAIAYLQTHELCDIRTQNVLYDLLKSYIPNDFVKPKKWCELIAKTDNLCCELYIVAAKYFAMIGEYDIADTVADKGIEICKDVKRRRFLYYSPEGMMYELGKQKEDTNRYRTKKPYWPATEERRRAVAKFYDEKGIKYPRIEKRAEKVPENEFAPINECFESDLTSYCAFWCNEVFSTSAAKCIYQIGAVKVRNNNIVDTFEVFIRPWDASSNARKAAAKEAGISIDIIESAEDVDLVMPKFFAFVGEDVLVSTGALGNQVKLISRAARYAGMKEIKNEFYDILDFAADISKAFDLGNNTREYLLSHFAIAEGKMALEKAQINKQLYDTLMSYGG